MDAFLMIFTVCEQSLGPVIPSSELQVRNSGPAECAERLNNQGRRTLGVAGPLGDDESRFSICSCASLVSRSSVSNAMPVGSTSLSIANCRPLTASAVAAPVIWKSDGETTAAALRSIAGKAVAVEIEMQAGMVVFVLETDVA